MKNALETALDALSRRALTRRELEERLAGKGFSGEEVNGALSRLHDWGYIDDRNLALEYCRIRSQRYSRLRLREELKRRGVDLLLIDEALAETLTEEQELEQCRTLAQKLWEQENRKKANGSETGVHESSGVCRMTREKVGASLVRRGYPLSVVIEALDNFCKSG